jgi:putative glycosyltransferase
MLTNSISSFSDKPLIMIFYTGACISLLSVLYIAYLVAMWMIYSISVEGWTSLLVSVWFLGGLSISFIGIIGIYLSKIFLETKARPYTIVKDVYGRESLGATIDTRQAK